MEKGDIICVNEPGFYASAQRFFTKFPYTHTAVCIGEVCGHVSIFEAKTHLAVTPLQYLLEDKEKDFEIYKVNIDPIIKSKAMDETYYAFAGSIYGYAQILWFIYRWGCERFGLDVRKRKNWFTSGEICSEIVWHYLNIVSQGIPELNAMLNQWNADTIHVGDIVTICRAFPEIFVIEQSHYVEK